MTGGYTVATVLSWQPDTLNSAADGLSVAASALDDEIAAVRKAMELATATWRGEAGEAAGGRAERELRDGQLLSEALNAARAALAAGAVDIGTARAQVVLTVDAAGAEGHRVNDDGSVIPPPVPPVMSSPDHAQEAAAGYDAKQREVLARAGAIALDVSTALRAVADADRRTADALSRVEIPESMQAQVEGILAGLLEGKGLTGFLAGGAGGLALGAVVKDSWRTITKSKAYADFLRGVDGADDIFARGKPNGGFLRFLIGQRAAKIAGKAFLPLTVLTGAADVVTGGGYDGSRGWATRGFGAAGVLGGGTLIAMSTGLLASNPVGWTIAGTAVLAYGGWSLGNLVYDNHEAIGDFFSDTGSWTADKVGQGWDATVKAADDAKDWAGDRLGDAADLGKKLLPDVKLPKFGFG